MVGVTPRVGISQLGAIKPHWTIRYRSVLSEIRTDSDLNPLLGVYQRKDDYWHFFPTLHSHLICHKPRIK